MDSLQPATITITQKKIGAATGAGVIELEIFDAAQPRIRKCPLDFGITGAEVPDQGIAERNGVPADRRNHVDLHHMSASSKAYHHVRIIIAINFNHLVDSKATPARDGDRGGVLGAAADDPDA